MEVQRPMHSFKFFIALTTLSQLHAGLGHASPAETVIEAPETFQYELYASDVQCWINGRCHGLIANFPKRRLAERLQRAVENTQTSIDFAIFGFRNQEWLLDALTDLKAAGVRIRVTLDQLRGAVDDWLTTSNYIYPDAIKLVDLLGQGTVNADVNIDGTSRTGTLMHHKFFIIDQKKVWFGSTNLSDTETGSEYNANVSLMVTSPALAKLFQGEFNQMYEARHYSIYKKARTAITTLAFKDGTKVRVLFSPQEKPIDQGVIPFIREAKESLSIGIFFLTDKKVADELIAAHERGVNVRIINDATAANNQYAHNGAMRAAGIDVRVENWGGKMHMKTAVRDGKDAIVGSANWTQAGNNGNDEHVVIIENNVKLAGEINNYFNSLWESLPTSLRPNYRDPRAEGRDSINSCVDGIDNDHQNGADAAGC